MPEISAAKREREVQPERRVRPLRQPKSVPLPTPKRTPVKAPEKVPVPA